MSISKSQDTVVASDYTYVIDRMNSINRKINSMADYYECNHSFSSSNETNTLFDQMNNVTSSYLGGLDKLMNKMSDEAKNIVLVAQSYRVLDENLSNKAEELK